MASAPPPDLSRQLSGPASRVLIEGHSSDVLDGLNLQRQAGSFLDFVMRVGDREIRAHRVVLAASIPYIAGLFSVGHQQEEIRLDELKFLNWEVLSQLVDFVYSGQLEVCPRLRWILSLLFNLHGSTFISQVITLVSANFLPLYVVVNL